MRPRIRLGLPSTNAATNTGCRPRMRPRIRAAVHECGHECTNRPCHRQQMPGIDWVLAVTDAHYVYPFRDHRPRCQRMGSGLPSTNAATNARIVRLLLCCGIWLRAGEGGINTICIHAAHVIEPSHRYGSGRGSRPRIRPRMRLRMGPGLPSTNTATNQGCCPRMRPRMHELCGSYSAPGSGCVLAKRCQTYRGHGSPCHGEPGRMAANHLIATAAVGVAGHECGHECGHE